jgi:hypothetical protein
VERRVDQAKLLADLAEAEHQVAEGKARIARQADVLRRLERDGEDSSEARARLVKLIEVQDLWEYDLQWVQRELDILA